MQRTNSGSHEIAQLLSVVQARRQYYRDVLSLLPVGVAVVAGDGAIRYANDAFCGQFAIPPESAATRAIGNILPSDVLNRRILAARLSGMAQGPFQLQIGNAAWSISITAVDYFKNNRE